MLHEKLNRETGQLRSDYTILLFYRGYCLLCEDALINLANLYQRLSVQNIRVITLTGDTTRMSSPGE